MLGWGCCWRSSIAAFLDWLPSCFYFVCSPAHTEVLAMENGIGFVAVAGGVFFSFAGGLVVLMRLMPARPVVQTVAQSRGVAARGAAVKAKDGSTARSGCATR